MNHVEISKPESHYVENSKHVFVFTQAEYFYMFVLTLNSLL